MKEPRESPWNIYEKFKTIIHCYKKLCLDVDVNSFTENYTAVFPTEREVLMVSKDLGMRQ